MLVNSKNLYIFDDYAQTRSLEAISLGEIGGKLLTAAVKCRIPAHGVCFEERIANLRLQCLS